MQNIALKISKFFVKKNIITEKDIDIYIYGLEIILSTFFTTLTLLITATIINSVIMVLIYLLITVPLRIFVGGYHANTYLKCLFLSNLFYCFISTIFKFLHNQSLSIIIWLLILYLSTIYIYVKSPVQNINHPLKKSILRRNKKIATLLLFVDCIFLTIFILLFPKSQICQFSILSILLVAILILQTQRKEGTP